MKCLQIESFDIKKIMKSGQCLRLREIGENKYSVIFRDHYLEITEKENGNYFFDCSPEELSEIWIDYFDLRSFTGVTAYKAINLRADPKDKYMQAVIWYGSGIRILRQDLWEVMVSAIISHGSNIYQARLMVDALCTGYGSRYGWREKIFYTFPSPEMLCNEDRLRKIGLNYKATIIANMAKAVVNGSIDLKYLREMAVISVTSHSYHNYLLSIAGISDTTASWIELFGLHKIDTFPVFAEIGQAIEREYNGKFPIEKYRGLEGIVQQYMLFYELDHRESKHWEGRQ